jgi:hypothetical protein
MLLTAAAARRLRALEQTNARVYNLWCRVVIVSCHDSGRMRSRLQRVAAAAAMASLTPSLRVQQRTQQLERPSQARRQQRRAPGERGCSLRSPAATAHGVRPTAAPPEAPRAHHHLSWRTAAAAAMLARCQATPSSAPQEVVLPGQHSARQPSGHTSVRVLGRSRARQPLRRTRSSRSSGSGSRWRTAVTSGRGESR